MKKVSLQAGGDAAGVAWLGMTAGRERKVFMRNIGLCDVTVSQKERDFSLSFREHLELAKLLDSLGVAVITLEGVGENAADALRIKSVAAAVEHSTLAVPVALEGENLEKVWEALQGARKPRLQVLAPVSPVQMEYLHRKKPDAMVAAVAKTVALCREKCGDVEFIAGDATRAEPEFLAKILAAAMEAGATTVTVCDEAGQSLPEEFGAFIASLRADVPGLKSVSLGVQCSDAMHMADACATQAVQQGAGEVKAAAYPRGGCALEKIARILSVRGESLGAGAAVHMPRLQNALERIGFLCSTERKKTSPFDNGAGREDSGAVLTVHDSITAVTQAVQQMGYDLSAEDAPRVYDAFSRIAAKKEQVSSRELEAIVASVAMQVPPTYLLDTYAIQSGNTISSSAHLRLKKGEKALEGICLGDGPIDAAFLAIEQITGQHYELDDFQIQAVTEGREAMGQTIVRLRHGGKLFSGRGISTDIVCASIHAYLNALNKIVYEEETL